VSSDGNFRIKKGSTYTVDTLVNTALIGNAENAAKLLSENTVIKTVNSSENSFVAYMNEKAIKFGMNDTFFTSADGSFSELQKTTAYDTVIFLKHALLNTSFKKIYCSPVAVSWDGIIMNNPNEIVMENTTFTLGGGTGKYNNTEDTLAVTYYMNNNDKNPADRRNIIMAIYGLDSENTETVQKQLLDKYHKDWVKVLYREKNDVVSILTLGSQNLSLMTTNDICFYAPAEDTDYIENVTFSYAEGYAPDVIEAPVYENTPICIVRYQLKDKTVFDVTLYAQNTIISERTTVNKMVGLISQYPEIFLTIFVLCIVTMLFALRKIYWHFALK
jgi:D-alanyl-D-alanine carboxypeptidase